MAEVKVTRLPHAEGLALPAYATEGAAGMDVLAALGLGGGSGGASREEE